eukprot:gnl/Dysnectes_brevis/807_a890_2703.p1 GENE.gnl/Dysnectes_brevis/807_a890_2703~~gnl/Dysnectes_brevis/807_a890_2703.p1  ORF type:complete len:558 (+),score=191.23 gnl/Dysnectes_brevis/807_a890_2703:1791-3464(+)
MHFLPPPLFGQFLETMTSNPQFVGMAQDESGRPLYIIRDQGGKSRAKGIAAHKANIAVARALANTLRTSLGPRGMDKLLVSSDRDITITNDGATILQKMDVDNHIAHLLVDLSRCQDNEIGDGTTGVVVLAGALLEQAEMLLDKGIHPIRISDGFDRACQIATDRLREVADTQDFKHDREILVKAAMTSLGSKIVNRYHEHMANVAVNAVLSVADIARGDVDFELIKVRSKVGGKLEDTCVFPGILLEQELSHSGMPRTTEKAKIAILTCPFEPPKLKTSVKIDIDSAAKYDALYQEEQRFFVDMVQRVKDSGANFVICQWGFDDEANHLLMRAGLPSVRWVKGEDIEAVALATGGQIVARFEDLSPEKLGTAEICQEELLGTTGDRVIKIEGFDTKRRISTVFIRGGNKMLIDEVHRSLHDAMCVTRNLIRHPEIVYGGGASEICCSLAVSSGADEVGTVEQYALRAFADALDAVPLTLARNSGMQPIQTLAELKKRQMEEGCPRLGVDCLGKGTSDMREQNVFETLSSKVQQLLLATQVVRMILKIDEIIDEPIQ